MWFEFFKGCASGRVLTYFNLGSISSFFCITGQSHKLPSALLIQPNFGDESVWAHNMTSFPRIASEQVYRLTTSKFSSCCLHWLSKVKWWFTHLWTEEGLFVVFFHFFFFESLTCAQLFCDPVGCLWGFAGKNTGVGCHFLLQGNFLTQELNPWLLPCLIHCSSVLYCWVTRKAMTSLVNLKKRLHRDLHHP